MLSQDFDCRIAFWLATLIHTAWIRQIPLYVYSTKAKAHGDTYTASLHPQRRSDLDIDGVSLHPVSVFLLALTELFFPLVGTHDQTLSSHKRLVRKPVRLRRTHHDSHWRPLEQTLVLEHNLYAHLVKQDQVVLQGVIKTLERRLLTAVRAVDLYRPAGRHERHGALRFPTQTQAVQDQGLAPFQSPVGSELLLKLVDLAKPFEGLVADSCSLCNRGCLQFCQLNLLGLLLDDVEVVDVRGSATEALQIFSTSPLRCELFGLAS